MNVTAYHDDCLSCCDNSYNIYESIPKLSLDNTESNETSIHYGHNVVENSESVEETLGRSVRDSHFNMQNVNIKSEIIDQCHKLPKCSSQNNQFFYFDSNIKSYICHIIDYSLYNCLCECEPTETAVCFQYQYFMPIVLVPLQYLMPFSFEVFKIFNPHRKQLSDSDNHVIHFNVVTVFKYTIYLPSKKLLMRYLQANAHVLRFYCTSKLQVKCQIESVSNCLQLVVIGNDEYTVTRDIESIKSLNAYNPTSAICYIRDACNHGEIIFYVHKYPGCK